MIKVLCLILVFSLGVFPVLGIAANAPELTACGIVTGADAQTFIGSPLDVKESAKVPTAEGASSYTSVCSYLGRGENFQEKFEPLPNRELVFAHELSDRLSVNILHHEIRQTIISRAGVE